MYRKLALLIALGPLIGTAQLGIVAAIPIPVNAASKTACAEVANSSLNDPPPAPEEMAADSNAPAGEAESISANSEPKGTIAAKNATAAPCGESAASSGDTSEAASPRMPKVPPEETVDSFSPATPLPPKHPIASAAKKIVAAPKHGARASTGHIPHIAATKKLLPDAATPEKSSDAAIAHGSTGATSAAAAKSTAKVLTKPNKTRPCRPERKAQSCKRCSRCGRIHCYKKAGV